MRRLVVLGLMGMLLVISSPAWGHVEAYDDNGNYLGEYLGGFDYWEVFVPSLSATVIVNFGGAGEICPGGGGYTIFYDNPSCSGTPIINVMTKPSTLYCGYAASPPDYSEHYYLMSQSKAYEVNGYYSWRHLQSGNWTCEYSAGTYKVVALTEITLDQIPFPVPVALPIRLKMHQDPPTPPAPTDAKAAPGLTLTGAILMSLGLIGSGIYALRRTGRS